MTGDRIIAAQRERVERLRAAGQNTAEAEHLLARFERSQAMFVDDLKRLQDLGVSLWQTELRTSLSRDRCVGLRADNVYRNVIQAP